MDVVLRALRVTDRNVLAGWTGAEMANSFGSVVCEVR